ncbi:hypothetical protein LPB140_00375 [Sphingorhabdus lutea]|uniref:CHAT domain-containing protein n=1 Tax=Sphingorhabdus lutea TaxID=1913578 RepID=A0A1L3J8U0_9SPHN|nr:CHAT domain-containing tetratricopeptide repeat protein [Sphingorhabdus lutea]APG61556.1 hypothetical protein LPB140_00375 [Sphingorhabdus lutea]
MGRYQHGLLSTLSPLALMIFAASMPQLAHAFAPHDNEPANNAQIKDNVSLTDTTTVEKLTALYADMTPDQDPAAYRALVEPALEEAQRIFPENHPEVAQRKVDLAMAYAAAGDLERAGKDVDPLHKILEQYRDNPKYRQAFRNALSLKSYVLNFQSKHDEALAININLVADYKNDPNMSKSRDYAVSLNNLAASYFEQGDLEKALDYNKQATEMARTLDKVPSDIAIWLANRVAYLYTAGRTDDAIVAAQNGVATGEASIGGDNPVMANLYANLGSIYYRQGRPRDSFPMIRRAYELVEKSAGKPTQNSAAMRVIYAQALSEAGRYGDAISFLDNAIPIIDMAIGEKSDRALVARDTFANALAKMGQVERALLLAQSLVETRDASLPMGHRDRVNSRDLLAKIAFQAGDYDLALQAAGQAVSMRGQMLPTQHPDALLSRAMLLKVQAQLPGADKENITDEAQKLLDEFIVASNIDLQSAQAKRLRPGFAWLAEIFYNLGQADDAFIAQQWAARSSVDDILAAAAAERSMDNAAAKTLFEQRRDLLNERSAILAKLEGNLRKPDPAFDMGALDRQLEDNRVKIDALHHDMGAQQIAALQFTAQTLNAMQAKLGPQNLALIYSRIDNGWLLTAANNDAHRQILISNDAEIEGLITNVRAGLQSDASAYDAAAATKLYAILFPKEMQDLTKGRTALLISANGKLGALPFSALMMENGLQKGVSHHSNYLIDKFAIMRFSGAPRGTDNGYGQENVQDKDLGDFWAVGGVSGKISGDNMAVRSAENIRTLFDLPQLTNAAAELRQLADAIGPKISTLFIGQDATEANIRSAEIKQGAILAFATHGLVSGELDGLNEPALLLTPQGGDDGLLLSSEIGKMSLPASWVILSACNTAAPSGMDAPQLSGLAQSFFQAGAQQVMASHWRVRDDMARRLSVATMRNAAKGMDSAQALQHAISQVRQGKDGEKAEQHPFLWAAFEIIGQ